MRDRKKYRLGFCTAVIVLWLHVPGSAEDRPREPPKDGTWIRYGKIVENMRTGKKYDPVTVTLSFTGSQIEDGQLCRWLELKQSIPDGEEGAGTYVAKVLVPEKDLWETDKPFAHARRSWIRKPDGAVTPPPKGSRDDMTYDELLLWTPGLLKGSAPADEQPRDIEYQAGRLEACRASTGELIYKPNPGEKYTRKYIAWNHPDLPMGFAELRIVYEGFVGNKSVSCFSGTYLIQDAGTGAKSELPDHN